MLSIAVILLVTYKVETTDKPGSVVDNHSSGTDVTISLKQPTQEQYGSHMSASRRSSIWSCSRWGLPCHFCYQKRGALLPHPFTLTESLRRYTLCCTGRGLAPPRCYLAPYPMEPGLSSPILLSVRLPSRLSALFYLKASFSAVISTLADRLRFYCHP